MRSRAPASSSWPKAESGPGRHQQRDGFRADTQTNGQTESQSPRAPASSSWPKAESGPGSSRGSDCDAAGGSIGGTFHHGLALRRLREWGSVRTFTPLISVSAMWWYSLWLQPYYIYTATWPRDIRPPGRNPGESVEGHRTHIPRRRAPPRGHTDIVVPS